MTGTRRLATNFQLWRLNSLGLLAVVDYPDQALEEPLDSATAKEILAGAAQLGLWTPQPRGERGERRWDSAAS